MSERRPSAYINNGWKFHSHCWACTLSGSLQIFCCKI